MSITETSTWIDKMIASPQNGTTDFIITLTCSGRAIGKIGIWQASEIGFLLSRTYWTQGLAQEALSAVLFYFFEERGVSEVTAAVDLRNQRCLRFLEKRDFTRTGFRERTWEVGGVWVDSLYLGLERGRWEEGIVVNQGDEGRGSAAIRNDRSQL